MFDKFSQSASVSIQTGNLYKFLSVYFLIILVPLVVALIATIAFYNFENYNYTERRQSIQQGKFISDYMYVVPTNGEHDDEYEEPSKAEKAKAKQKEIIERLGMLDNERKLFNLGINKLISLEIVAVLALGSMTLLMMWLWYSRSQRVTDRILLLEEYKLEVEINNLERTAEKQLSALALNNKQS